MPLPASEHPDGRSTLLEWRIASDIAEVSAVVEAVRAACIAAGYPPKVCRLNVPVALTEAVTNAIKCGNAGERSRPVHIRACINQIRLRVDITDEGSGFDVEAVRKRCQEEQWVTGESGRGVFLMHSLMDKVETWRDHGHTVRLTLHRA